MSAYRRPLETNVETRQQSRLRLHRGGIHASYLCCPGPLFEESPQPIQSDTVSLGEYLDRSVGTVPHPSRKTEARRLPLGGVAKADTLDDAYHPGGEGTVGGVVRESHQSSWSCSTAFSSAPAITATEVSQNQSSNTTAAPSAPYVSL